MSFRETCWIHLETLFDVAFEFWKQLHLLLWAGFLIETRSSLSRYGVTIGFSLLKHSFHSMLVSCLPSLLLLPIRLCPRCSWLYRSVSISERSCASQISCCLSDLCYTDRNLFIWFLRALSVLLRPFLYVLRVPLCFLLLVFLVSLSFSFMPSFRILVRIVICWLYRHFHHHCRVLRWWHQKIPHAFDCSLFTLFFYVFSPLTWVYRRLSFMKLLNKEASLLLKQIVKDLLICNFSFYNRHTCSRRSCSRTWQKVNLYSPTCARLRTWPIAKTWWDCNTECCCISRLDMITCSNLRSSSKSWTYSVLRSIAFTFNPEL